MKMSPNCPPQANTGHFVHGHIHVNSEIIWRSKGRIFSKPGVLSSASGQIQGRLQVLRRTSCELHHLGEVSSSLLWQLSHTSPKCTIWRDPLSPVSCGGKTSRIRQAAGRGTGGWKHRYQNTTPTQGEETIADTVPTWPGNEGCSPKMVKTSLSFKVRHFSSVFRPLHTPLPLLFLGKPGAAAPGTVHGVPWDVRSWQLRLHLPLRPLTWCLEAYWQK